MSNTLFYTTHYFLKVVVKYTTVVTKVDEMASFISSQFRGVEYAHTVVKLLPSFVAALFSTCNSTLFQGGRVQFNCISGPSPENFHAEVRR